MPVMLFERAARRALPRLTEAELDARIAERESAVAAAVASLRAGTCPPCNQRCNQGRACPAHHPQAAEPCTEIGADAPEPADPPMTGRDLLILLAALALGLALEWWLVTAAIDAYQAWSAQ